MEVTGYGGAVERDEDGILLAWGRCHTARASQRQRRRRGGWHGRRGSDGEGGGIGGGGGGCDGEGGGDEATLPDTVMIYGTITLPTLPLMVNASVCSISTNVPSSTYQKLIVSPPALP